MRHCPNCQQPVPDGRDVCPNCGADVSATWPPPPAGQEHRPSGDEGAGGGTAQAGFTLGCLLSAPLYYVLGALAFMSHLIKTYPRGYPSLRPYPVFRYGGWPINLVPLALVGLLYVLLRPRFPRFARGLGYCLIVILALLLYGPAACRNY